jgi:glycerol-3-phosphate dehydrogenase subunit B
LSAQHPYTKLGLTVIQEAMGFFLSVCVQAGYPYIGSLNENFWLPTAAGTLKPSCLVPKTMDAAELNEAEKIVVVGFAGLKDYYPELIVHGLARIAGDDKRYSAVTLNAGWGRGRDITALDIARWLDTEEGRQQCLAGLKSRVSPGGILLLPPVLGTNPDYYTWKMLQEATGCRLVEITGIPPAVTGLRLQKLLLAYLKQQGVAVVEQADVITAETENRRCLALVTGQPDRKRHYWASAFVLATGGFWGGGLTAYPGGALENIFKLPLAVPDDQQAWSNAELLSATRQPFACFGVVTDGMLRPLTGAGEVALENVYFAGASLAGCDYCFEKSGNGMAVISGYHAGSMARRRDNGRM